MLITYVKNFSYVNYANDFNFKLSELMLIY